MKSSYLSHIPATLITILVTLLFLSSCSKDDDIQTPSGDYVIITPEKQNVYGGGSGQVSVRIKSNTTWSAGYNNSPGYLEILSVSPSSGKGDAMVTIRYAALPEKENYLQGWVKFYYYKNGKTRTHSSAWVFSKR